MKYLITTTFLVPGSGLSRYIFSLCKILQQPGNDIYILTTHNTNDIAYERAELDKINPNIKLISLGQKSKLSKYISVVSEIRKVNPDILVNNHNAVIQYILPLISKHIKTVHILHTDTEDCYRIGGINGKMVHGWIAPTEAIKTKFSQFTNTRFDRRVSIIPHGVEVEKTRIKDNKILNIVFTGVLYEHKGILVLPAIIKGLLSRGINFNFTIVGGGILEDWLKKEFKDEIDNGIVRMTGVIDHDKVYFEMSKADIFLYPTHIDTFGLVIAEAMMNGAVPVVSHLKGVTDNLIDTAKDGFLIQQDDVNAFIETIQLLADNPSLIKEMSIKAHQKALTRLSLPVMSVNYLKYFSSL